VEFPTDENVIVGLDKADDAGVYRLADDLAIIQTVDFFTPVVDDPYEFGQIAAANALSDIYAMGGTPKTAMNLVAFPANDMDIAILREIIQGGMEKLNEAEVVLVGGHSVEDKELKYGLSVTGFVHPDRILTKRDLRLGDQLILTKPLGIGIITTAIKGGLASEEIIKTATRLMATLNRQAADVMKDYPVHACTDITGFGLLGHLTEMVMDSEYGLRIHADNIPVLPEALDYAGMGLVPGGAFNNRAFYGPMVEIVPSVDPLIQDVIFDPQTSGGLLISVEGDSAKGLLLALKENGVQEATIIGEVVSGSKHKIEVIQE
jgi:selenide,water dikinase